MMRELLEIINPRHVPWMDLVLYLGIFVLVWNVCLWVLRETIKDALTRRNVGRKEEES